METFKKKVRMRIAWLLSTIIVFAAAFIALLFLRKSLPAISGYAQGFATGVFMGLIGLLLLHVIRNFSFLRSEEALKAQYVKEHDERALLIMQKTGSLGFQIAGGGLGFAAIMAGFLDQTVFLTLSGALAFIALVKLSLKLYFTKKY